jgi:quercetin dioxygenase-like cupin family protein
MRFLAKLLIASMLLAALSEAAAAQTIKLDPAIIGYKLPDQIPWKDNPSGNRTAVLQGDPTKPGPYAVLLQWLPGNMSRPHFHPNDRHFIVVSGTWWVGAGPEFDPEKTVPMPAGSSVTHFANGVHFDGAKGEQATILVWGEGPATSTPFAPPAAK